MYKKVETNLNFLEREKEIIKFWEENEVFKKSVDVKVLCNGKPQTVSG